MYVITNGKQFINTNSGIHEVNAFDKASILTYWKAEGVYNSIPKKNRQLWRVVDIPVSMFMKEKSEAIIDSNDERRINRFFESWDKLGAESNAVIPFNNEIIQKYWKALKVRNRKIIIESFGCRNIEEFKKLMYQI